MKRLLATTAIATSMAFAGAGAFAQTVPGATGETDPATNSLLHQILSDAAAVQLNVLNAAENLANLNATININESANVGDLLAALTASVGFGTSGTPALFTWIVDGEEFQGSAEAFQDALDAAGAAVGDLEYEWTADLGGGATTTRTGTLEAFAADTDAVGSSLTLLTDLSETGADIQLVSVEQDVDLVEGILRGISRTTNSLGNTTTAIDFFEPAATVAALQTTIGDLSTTAIGALNTGVIGEQDAQGNITRNVMHLVNQTEESIAQTTGSLAASAVFQEFGNMQLSNVALNAAEIVNASVNIDQLMANIDGVSTTVIGALNTGDIATDINTNASGITMALVGN